MDQKVVERLKSKIAYSGECWLFTGGKDKDGYGMIKVSGKNWRASRLSYTLFNGEIPTGLVIDHICRNRPCVNPRHLRAVTTRENVLYNSNSLQAANAKKTHCSKGHLLDGVTVGRQRWCSTCKAIFHKRWATKNRLHRNAYQRERKRKKREGLA